ncbi:hypothetical protein CARUB_v10024647mg [Capsella rubella]|uniref:sterol 22-desaturase n=1 Tax=Capsella rubella TaxID=81985 RepID=R0HSU6_9BRAS|nr:cytochrome P450 710A3 [Capsella rubella]EOA28440.1 hypothetical protein CARUB_v10024647mg [Capsella rubella]
MVSSSVSTFASLAPYLVSALLLFLLLEQLSYLVKKRNLPGPFLVPPIIGNVLALLRDPTSFWDKQSAMADNSVGLSANYLIGKFIVYVRDAELSNKIFANVRPDAFQLIGHPYGKKIFGDRSLIFMFGEEHKSVRRQVAPNFTRTPLSIYSSIQQTVILRHLRQWEENFSGGSQPVSMRQLIRELNLETSHTVFVGPYLDEEVKNSIRSDYNMFNRGTMALPIDLSGFAFGEARKAVSRLTNTMALCTRKSKAKMATGEHPTCLVDFWTHSIIAKTPPPPHSKDEEISCVLVDFLIAAQDASTSSLLWAVVLIESEPEVLRRVREEVGQIWSPESNTLITADQLAEMKYTRCVAREVLRYRTPASVVPHVAVSDFLLTESYTIPKGAVVFPSIYNASFQGFTEPDRFDPDRFSETRQEDQVFKRNFLAFGIGSHQCVGQRYALNQLVLFIAMFTSLLDFKRVRSDGCDEIVHCPTMSPKDGGMVFLSSRTVSST